MSIISFDIKCEVVNVFVSALNILKIMCSIPVQKTGHTISGVVGQCATHNIEIAGFKRPENTATTVKKEFHKLNSWVDQKQPN